MRLIQEVSSLWYKTSNRKPYYSLKDSLIDFFKSHVRFIHDSNTIESAFEKPYLDEEYPSMHLSWNIPTVEGGGIGPQNPPIASCREILDPTCQVQCFRVSDCLTRCQVVGGISNLAGGVNWTVFGGSFCGSGSDPGQAGFLSFPFIDICHECESSCSESFVVRADASWLEPKLCKEGTYQKGCGNQVPINCNPCSETTPIEFTWWDTQEDPPSVARGGSVVLSITGGTSPYTWVSDSSNGLWLDAGFTVNTLETAATSVTIYADATACPGVVTVTDVCENTASSGIFVTGHSSWGNCTGFSAPDSCIIGGASTYIGGTGLTVYVIRTATLGSSIYKLQETIYTNVNRVSVNSCWSFCSGTGDTFCASCASCKAPGQCITDAYAKAQAKMLIFASLYVGCGGSCGIEQQVQDVYYAYCLQAGTVTCKVLNCI